MMNDEEDPGVKKQDMVSYALLTPPPRLLPATLSSTPDSVKYEEFSCVTNLLAFTPRLQELTNFFFGGMDGQSRLQPGFNPNNEHYTINIGGGEKKLMISAIARNSAPTTKCEFIVDCVPPTDSKVIEEELEEIKSIAVRRDEKGNRVFDTVIQKVAKPEGPQKVATWQARCGPPTPTLIPWNRTAGARPTPNY